MEKIATENLFLLEFLVDTVNIDPKCDCDAPPGETCVSFQFLDNAPLDVCEQDFCPKTNLKMAENEVVKSGKSCLFSLSPEQATAALEQFDICVSVMKKMQPGWLPERVEIGSSVIAAANLFNELINSVELSDGSSPTAKTLKDVFDINDGQGLLIGKISVYIRMSCFGKLIVTQFQMNLDDKSVLFKDKDGKSLYRYKKAGKRKEGKAQSDYGSAGYNSKCPEVPCGSPGSAGGVQPGMSGGAGIGNPNCPFAPCGNVNIPSSGPSMGNQGTGLSPYPGGLGIQTMMTPCNECGFVPNPACLPPMSMGMSSPNMGSYSPDYRSTPPQAPDGNYQEIGASMGGNSLTIRVHKEKGKLEQYDPNNDDCTCGGETGAIVPAGSKSNQQAFSMRPGVAPNSPFSFRMGQGGDAPYGGAGNNVIVNPPVCTAADGTQFTEFSDPNKETFILRIGKKSEGVDKKNNLELELQTPKGPPLKPIPKKETVETQYDPLDAGPDDTGSKKGKGKGGKGGKGGKKGKGKK
ncbi:uncharacterized protein LOC126742510 [Anthonomus grandis grandis]|uniref:uncharacterized protein LOC126742510 n=1 Tax=Anthonomus grandis grandis TaxID=2921223 RepID=UPI0021661CA4|nr:uncharacterized protein LOC126742510 [Anthonomus grandis grandis]